MQVVSGCLLQDNFGVLDCCTQINHMKLLGAVMGRCLVTLGGYWFILAIVFSLDNRLLVFELLNEAVGVLDVHINNVIQAYQRHAETVLSVVLPPCKTMIAFGDGDRNILWSGTRLQIAASVARSIILVEYHSWTQHLLSPSQDSVASGSVNGKVTIYVSSRSGDV
jgi:hypothetical protein